MCGSVEAVSVVCLCHVCLCYLSVGPPWMMGCCISRGHVRNKVKLKLGFLELWSCGASASVITGATAWILLELADLGVAPVLFSCSSHLFISFAVPYNINLYFYIPSVSPSAASLLNLRRLSLLLTISLLSPRRPPPPSSSPCCYFTHHFSV